MRAISPLLVQRIRRADPAARIIIEGVKTVSSDIKDLPSEFAAADALTGFQTVNTGGAKLQGAENTPVENTVNSGTFITEMDVQSPFEVAEIEWGNGGADKVTELYEIEARLVARRVGGNPQTVAFWKAQLFRIARITDKGVREMAPITEAIEVAASGGDVPQLVSFPVSLAASTVDNPGSPGDPPIDERPENEREARSISILMIWALRSDGTAADNVGWDTDDALATMTNNGHTVRRRTLSAPAGQITEVGRTIVFISASTTGVPTFSLRGRDFAGAVTITWSGTANELNLGAAPAAANDIQIVAEGSTPDDSTLLFEINDGGGYVEVNDGDVIGVDNTPQGGQDLSGVTEQQTYDARVTLTPNADASVSPVVRRFGIQEVSRTDLDGIAVIADPQWQISPDTFKGEITETQIEVLKDGEVDYTDWASELLASSFLGEFVFRVRIGHPDLARREWLHIDDFFIEDYDPQGASIVFECVSALSKVRQALPAHTTLNDTRETLEYRSDVSWTAQTASEDIMTGRVTELGSRFIGPGIPSAELVAKRIEDSDAKDELDALAEVAGGGYTTDAGRIVFRDMTTKLSPVYEFERSEIAWSRVIPGYKNRTPEYFVPYDWIDGEGRFDAEVRSFHLNSITRLGLARIQVNNRLSDATSRWIYTEAVASAVASRRTRLQGTGLMLWQFTAAYPHPELQVGDTVRVHTDRFVARDPNTQAEIRGNVWATAVITKVGDVWGTKFQVWVRGFEDVIPTEISITRSRYGANTVDFIYERPQSAGIINNDQRWRRELSYLVGPAVQSVEIAVGGYLIQPTLDSGESTPTIVPGYAYHRDVTPNTTIAELLKAASPAAAIGNFALVDGHILLDDTNNGGSGPYTVGSVDQEPGRITVELQRTGTPTGAVACRIYADDNGLPGALVATSYTTLDASEVSTALNDLHTFSFAPGGSLTANQVYWIAIEYSGGTATDFIGVGRNNVGTGGDSAILNGAWAANTADDWIDYLAIVGGNADYGITYDEFNLLIGGGGSVNISITSYDQPGGAFAQGNPGSTVTESSKNITEYDDLGIRAPFIVDRRVDTNESFGSPGVGPNNLDLDDAANGFAFVWTPSASGSLSALGPYLRRVGTPTGDLTMRIFSDTPSETGTVTTADAAGDVLMDSAALFVTNLTQVGAIVTNDTDGAWGRVLTVDSETQLTLETGGLMEGYDNAFGLGDAYTVSGLPNTALATSETVDSATLGTGYPANPASQIDFATPQAVTKGTIYHIAHEYSGGTATDFVQVGSESAGRNSELNGGWAAGSAETPTYRIFYEEKIQRIAHALTPGSGLISVFNEGTGELEFEATEAGSTLGGLTDVTVTAVANDEVLQFTGTVWENQTLAQAGISPALHGHPAAEITAGTFDAGDFVFPGAIQVADGGAADVSVRIGATNRGFYHETSVPAIAGVYDGTVVFSWDDNRWQSGVPLRLGDGSLALPSYAFTGDINSGVTLVGGNVLALVGNGVARLSIDVAGGAIQIQNEFVVPDGTAADPPYSFVNSGGSGMYLAGTNQIGWSTAAVARMDLDSGGLSVVADVISNTSDRRLKKDIDHLVGALDAVMSWDVFRYRYIDFAIERGLPSGRRIGLYAQDIQRFAPEAVVPAPFDSEYLTYDNKMATAVLAAAVQDLAGVVEGIREELLG